MHTHNAIFIALTMTLAAACAAESDALDTALADAEAAASEGSKADGLGYWNPEGFPNYCAVDPETLYELLDDPVQRFQSPRGDDHQKWLRDEQQPIRCNKLFTIENPSSPFPIFSDEPLFHCSIGIGEGQVALEIYDMLGAEPELRERLSDKFQIFGSPNSSEPDGWYRYVTRQVGNYICEGAERGIWGDELASERSVKCNVRLPAANFLSAY